MMFVTAVEIMHRGMISHRTHYPSVNDLGLVWICKDPGKQNTVQYLGSIQLTQGCTNDFDTQKI